ncbi:MarR family winged helix-turn-helix transcriptional regulator [Thermoactinomyces mirandus]|uniref:MarR family transcriptional regulator n=1 Tax=Thermoactinomyces mirandus TaxID=2756294 RepID=A0A7W1XU86_9BACL|nr:MarR family transcriptional regulator [Thermoactinomyces mirandus]MBA4603369.1 MarR family transcriptional regulator [Thermoactinomyces mirandus]
MRPTKGIGFEIKVLSHLIKRCINDHVIKTRVKGLTGLQGIIIRYIFVHSQTRDVYQRDLENEFNIRRSSVTGVLQLMERNGLITREHAEHDARLKKLKLTPKAIKIHKIITQAIIEVEKKLRKDLSEDEINSFYTTLNKIKKNLEK